MSDYFTASHRDELLKENKELKDRIKRMEEMYEGVIGERPDLLGSNVMGLLKRELNAAQQRIKRLEEAGDKAILNSYLPDRLAMWAKAKEAKLSVNPIQSLGENLMKAGIGFTTEDKP